MAASAARVNLTEIVTGVTVHQTRAPTTRSGEPGAVPLSIDDLETIEETIAILVDANVTVIFLK